MNNFWYKILLYTFIYILSGLYLWAITGSQVFLPDGRAINLHSEKINNKLYVPYSEISSQIFPKSFFHEENGEIVTAKIRLKVAPGSFYVLLDESGDLKVSQMSLPAIIYNSRILVPFEPFFRSLDNLGCFDVVLGSNYVTLNDKPKQVIRQNIPRLVHKRSETEFHKETIQNKSDIPNFKPLRIPSKDNDTDAYYDNKKAVSFRQADKTGFTSDTDNKTNELKEEVKPDHYIIPKDLIRKGMHKSGGQSNNADSLKSQVQPDVHYYYYLNYNDAEISSDELYASLEPEPESKSKIIEIKIIQKKNL